jgi:hypothetical protein
MLLAETMKLPASCVQNGQARHTQYQPSAGLPRAHPAGYVAPAASRGDQAALHMQYQQRAQQLQQSQQRYQAAPQAQGVRSGAQPQLTAISLLQQLHHNQVRRFASDWRSARLIGQLNPCWMVFIALVR